MIDTPARLDRWLWFARFFKSRTRATVFCERGRIRINGTPVGKAHYHIRPGDVLTFPLAARVRVIRVVALAQRRGPAPEARSSLRRLDSAHFTAKCRGGQWVSSIVRAGAAGRRRAIAGRWIDFAAGKRQADEGCSCVRPAAVLASSMLERLQALFGAGPGAADVASFEPLTLSAAALMLYAAQLDGVLDEAERRTVTELLERRFGLGDAETERLMSEAGARAEAATDLYSLTRDIKDGLSAEQRAGIVEMLWEVVLSDGTVDSYEFEPGTPGRRIAVCHGRRKRRSPQACH